MTKIQKAEREFDLNNAAVLKYGELPELQKQLKKEEELYLINESSKVDSSERMLNDTVKEDDIAAIVSTWTGKYFTCFDMFFLFFVCFIFRLFLVVFFCCFYSLLLVLLIVSLSAV